MSVYSPTPYLCRRSELSTELVVVPASALVRIRHRMTQCMDGRTMPTPRRHPVYGPAVRIHADIRSAENCVSGERQSRPATLRAVARAAAELASCWRFSAQMWPTESYAVTAGGVA